LANNRRGNDPTLTNFDGWWNLIPPKVYNTYSRSFKFKGFSRLCIKPLFGIELLPTLFHTINMNLYSLPTCLCKLIIFYKGEVSQVITVNCCSVTWLLTKLSTVKFEFVKMQMLMKVSYFIFSPFLYWFYSIGSHYFMYLNNWLLGKGKFLMSK
jgi:hypothetical protein